MQRVKILEAWTETKGSMRHCELKYNNILPYNFLKWLLTQRQRIVSAVKTIQIKTTLFTTEGNGNCYSLHVMHYGVSKKWVNSISQCYQIGIFGSTIT